MSEDSDTDVQDTVGHVSCSVHLFYRNSET